jgi:AraC-like DNA-binding protein
VSADLEAWRPGVAGVREVLHARFVDHAYPVHTHEVWTLLVVDQGIVRYDLDRHPHATVADQVTVLPPGVPHDGRSALPGGFRKRVLYLERDLLGDDLTGAAVDQPSLADGLLRTRVDQLHRVLGRRTESLEAESRLTLVRDRLLTHLRPGRPTRTAARSPQLAHRLRELIDARVTEGVTLAEAATQLHAHPTHLVRAFSQEFGIAPHRYLTGRRVELARTLLLAGRPTSSAAVEAGFHDQSHLTRHFRAMLGTSPAAYARG